MTTNPSRPTRVRLTVLGMLCLVSFFGYVLRTNMSIAGEAMMKDLGMSEVQFGMVLSAFAWAYGLFQLPGGLFGDRLGGRRSMALLTLGWGILTLFTGLVPGPPVPLLASMGALLVLRFLVGVTQAPLYPITAGVAIADWFPPTAWAFTNGLTTSALGLGAAAAGPGIAWLVTSLGWRQSFIVTAPLGLIAAGLWWWLYRDEPAEHPAVNPAEVNLIRAGRLSRRRTPAPGSWKTVLADRGVLAITASYFCTNYVFYLYFNWFYYYLVDVRGFSRQVGGWYSGAQWIGGAVTACLGGWLCDRLSTSLGPATGCRLTVVGGLLLAAPLLVAGAMAQDPILAVVLLSLSFASVQLTDAGYWAAGMRIGGEHAAGATGLMNTGGNLVGGIGALLVPLVSRSFGWTAALGTGAVFAVLAAGLWVWIRADRVAGTPAPAG